MILLQLHRIVVTNFVPGKFGLFRRNPWQPLAEPWGSAKSRLKNTGLDKHTTNFKLPYPTLTYLKILHKNLAKHHSRNASWPKPRIWDLCIRRNGSTAISKLCTQSVTLWTPQNPIFVLEIALSPSWPKTHDHRWGWKQRPILKLTALWCLIAPVLWPQSDEDHADCICFTNPCINLFLVLRHLWIPHQVHELLDPEYLEKHIVFNANFHFPFVARSWKSISAWRSYLEDAPNTKTSAKSKRSIPQLSTVNPRRLGYDCPSNSYGLCRELVHTSLLESNIHGERLWFEAADTDTYFWTRIQGLDGSGVANVETARASKEWNYKNLNAVTRWSVVTRALYATAQC